MSKLSGCEAPCSQKEACVSSHCLPATSPFPASASYSADAPSPLHLCPSVERDVKFYSYRLPWKCKVGCRDVLRVLLWSLLQEQKERTGRDLSERACADSQVSCKDDGVLLLRTLASVHWSPGTEGWAQTTTTCIKCSTKADGWLT